MWGEASCKLTQTSRRFVLLILHTCISYDLQYEHCLLISTNCTSLPDYRYITANHSSSRLSHCTYSSWLTILFFSSLTTSSLRNHRSSLGIHRTIEPSWTSNSVSIECTNPAMKTTMRFFEREEDLTPEAARGLITRLILFSLSLSTNRESSVPKLSRHSLQVRTPVSS